MTTELITVRHGETCFNRRGIWQGQTDSALTANGEAQARALMPRIGALASCATVYSSDLGRARRTAALIADTERHVLALEPGLRERDFGVFQGLARDEIARRYPDAWTAHNAGDPDSAPPGGESLRQLCRRVVAAFHRIAARHPGERIVAVSHGGVLSTFAKHVLGLPLGAPRRFHIANTSISVFHLDATGRWMLRSLGDTAHLQDQ